MFSEENPPAFGSLTNLRVDYARLLNPQQHAAVTALPGPALVIAGAGSGKTRTLTYRVAYLLEQGIPPERILLLTFTNKAAAEMMRRTSEILSEALVDLWGGTFHSIGYRILRRHAAAAGLGPDFTLLDQEDSNKLIKLCRDEYKAESQETIPEVQVLRELFSLAANTGSSISETIDRRFSALVPFEETAIILAKRYTAMKRQCNVVDFDDLLVLWLDLLRTQSDILDRYQRRFQFILVDEYQDTNFIQSAIVDLLADRHKNVMAVGDDAQSIYSWRGAEFSNIRDFPKRYPAAQIFRIEINYRSTPEILALANGVMAASEAHHTKILTSARPSGMVPVAVVCETPRHQAKLAALRVRELSAEGVPLSQIAVLYRSRYHAVDLQLEFDRQRIPHIVMGGVRFLELAHIKDLLAHLRWLHNPSDEIAFRRIVMLLGGIGEKRAERLFSSFSTLWKDARSKSQAASLGSGVIGDCLARIEADVPKRGREEWQSFTDQIVRLEEISEDGNVADMLQVIWDSGYDACLQRSYPDYDARKEDVAALIGFSGDFSSLETFLAEVALRSGTEEEEQGAGTGGNRERVRLSTIHQVKGLEFSVVFMIGLSEGLFPSARSSENPNAIEEERRLFYVAATRAKDQLYLFAPKFIMRGGVPEGPVAPSRFLQRLTPGTVQQLYFSEWETPFTMSRRPGGR